MKLRLYQWQAVERVRTLRYFGIRRLLLVLATGGGKTVILGYVTASAVRQGKRCLWLVNRTELVDQTVRTLEAFGLSVGHRGQNLTAPVQVMTYQECLARGEVPPADELFPDEAHHLGDSGEWISILKAYPDAGVTAATATPERGDGKGLDYFDHLEVVAQPEDLVALWRETSGRHGLVPCHVLKPSRVLEKGIATTPAKATLLHKFREHQQVVFAGHVKAAEEFCAEFITCGISAEVLTGKTPRDVRVDMLGRFARGELRVIVNVYVLTEGWDCPAVDLVTIACRPQTIGRMIQMTGRGARPAPNKTRFVVMDLCGVTNDVEIGGLGHPFQNREFRLTGDAYAGPPIERVVLRLCKRCQAEMPEDGDTCATPGCGWKRPALEVPKALNERLEVWEARAKFTSDQRLEKMVWWIRQAHSRGQHKTAIGIASHTYKGFFREEKVPDGLVSHALAVVAGRAWCATCKHSVRDGRCRCAVAGVVRRGGG